MKKDLIDKNAVVGACGVCCTTCRFHYTLGCECSAGTEEVAKQKVKTNWNGRGILCLVCKCAVEKGIAYVLETVKNFPAINIGNGISLMENLI